MNSTTTGPRSWADLLAIDPSLEDIDRLVDSRREEVRIGNQWLIYDEVKCQLRQRLGWEAECSSPELQTSEAYEIGIQHVCERLGV